MTTTLPDQAEIITLSKHYQAPRETIRQILGLPKRRRHRGKRESTPEIADRKDRWERFQRITRQARDLFEDEGETQRWLSTPKEALERKTPLEAMATEQGAKKVEELLYRAEYGIFG